MSNKNCNTLDIDPNGVKSSCASKFRNFEPLSFAGLKAITESTPSKTCDLDPLPTDILKKCIDLSLPEIHNIVNLSLSMSYFPDIIKKACVTPLIKNENLDNDKIEKFQEQSVICLFSKSKLKNAFFSI